MKTIIYLSLIFYLLIPPSHYTVPPPGIYTTDQPLLIETSMLCDWLQIVPAGDIRVYTITQLDPGQATIAFHQPGYVPALEITCYDIRWNPTETETLPADWTITGLTP